MRGIVFGSHGSAATISAPLFNFGYRPGSHCSPAFPNLGGIPLPGNIVYNRRHEAQPLGHHPNPLPFPDYPFTLLAISIFVIHFPFTPLAMSRPRLSLPVLGLPWIIPAGSRTERRRAPLSSPPDLLTHGNLL